MEEISLINRAKNGDDEAFYKIYEKYQGIIFIKMRKYYLFNEEKDDLIQEGRIGLFRAVQSYDRNKEASFATFASLCISRQIFTAIKRSHAQKYRILKMATEHFKDNQIDNIIFFQHNDPESIFLGKEKLTHLKDKLKSSLSKMEKEVFNYMILGFNYKEIADKTGRKSKTIDNTMQRIKRKIKQHLEY